MSLGGTHTGHAAYGYKMTGGGDGACICMVLVAEDECSYKKVM